MLSTGSADHDGRGQRLRQVPSNNRLRDPFAQAVLITVSFSHSSIADCTVDLKMPKSNEYAPLIW